MPTTAEQHGDSDKPSVPESQIEKPKVVEPI
jgi:hypothetical protein